MGHRFRNRARGRRRRRLESKRAVASAIAVLFIILIFIAALNSYLVTTLPGQMALLEQQHVLQTENAFVQLRANILEEANHPNHHLMMNSPIPMQSQGMPPFGLPASSTLTADPTTSAVGNFSYQMGTVTPIPQNWVNASGIIIQSGNCLGGTPVQKHIAGNNTTMGVKITGNGCKVIYNATGSNDAILITSAGNNNGSSIVIIEGNNDSIWANLTGNSGNHQYVNFYIFGTNDSYHQAITGGGSKKTAAGVTANVTFVGYTGGLCPAGTLSSTDKFFYPPTGYNIFDNVTWVNSYGNPNSNASNASWWGYNNTVKNEFIHFENDTHFIACAFTVVNSNNFGLAALSGIFDQLNNRYYPSESIGFEEGAVVVGTGPLSSSMAEAPLISVNSGPNGYVLNMTIIQLVLSNPQVRSGGSVSGVETHLISESQISYTNSPQSVEGKAPFLVSPFFLNVTTLYPMAWLEFFDSLIHVIPSSGATAIFAPQSGFSTWRVVAPLTANGFDIRIVTVGVSFN